MRPVITYFGLFLASLFLASGVFAQEAHRDGDTQKSRESAQAVSEKSDAELKEEQDAVWMMLLFTEIEKSQYKRAITPLEASRIEDIYETSAGDAKLYAFSMMPLFQDVSRWIKELEVLFQSNERDHAAIAVEAVEWKLKEGSEREKIILSNNETVIAALKSLPERFPADEVSLKKVRNIEKLATPFRGRAIPESKERPPASERQPDVASQASDDGISPAVIAVSLLLAGGVGVLLWPKLRKGK